MEKKIGIVIIAAATLFMLALMPAAYAAEQGKTDAAAAEKAKPAMKQAAMKQAPMTVTGTIIANKNKKGKIVSYTLQEDNGQSLMLSKHGKGMELRKMVGDKIEATGTVQESKGAKMITVQAFKKIE